MGVPGFIGVKGERGPVGPQGDTGPPGKSCTLTKYTDCSLVTSLCFLSWSLHDLSLLQVSVGSQATRVLLHFPSEFQERGALQDRRVSKDQRGSEGDQGHRAPLGMQVRDAQQMFC